ncbi:MAG: ABC-F family ATP-binding cassette domain-containing protein [Oscillospiraceae bacterium]|jgi:ATPase subunit of ABC transporter with duplicated ATPase domains|nr:ABC-F family ATP-binding cassette domain-containing protein [Oscillospiraceae bacterium]
MIDIAIQGLVKAFEQDINILDGLTFNITSGERVGILGKNGAGKTTLFRIMTGEVRQDAGTLMLAPGKRMGLISQIPVYPAGCTVEDVLRSAHVRIFALESRLSELSAKMARSGSETLMREYDEAAADFERLGGYNAEVERNRVANGLEIGEAMRAQLFSELSGGEKTRVNLARLILEDTDILLLDEPTNHLDLRATEWLEEYLRRFRGTVLVVSHDRYFLDRVVSRIIEIRDGKAEFYSGNYSFYIAEKQRRYEEQLKKYEKERKELKRLDEAARRLYRWGTGNEKLMKRSFAIRTRMARVEKTDRPKAERAMQVKFARREFSGDEVLIIEGVEKSYGDRVLFSGLGLIVEGGERIALIGDNGTGKSTLIKLIMGEELPDTGILRRGPAVKTAYLPQLIRFDFPGRSLLDTLLYSEKCTPQAARDRLGSFRFSGEDVFKPVSALSGGEQSRLRLCMLMRGEVNFLIMDEPTNHLDIQSREWIEDALEDYHEALLFVSHDRYFVERFATRIWELDNGAITDFRGSFSEFREYKKRRNTLAQNGRSAGAPKEGPKKAYRGNPPAYREKQLQRAERDIEGLEDKLRALDALCEANASDFKKLMALDKEKAQLRAELDALYLKWEALSGSSEDLAGEGRESR